MILVHVPVMGKGLVLVWLLLEMNFVHLSGLGNDSIDGTVRIDPLNGFKKYRGGYDLRNKHYWSSTVFSGIYGYALAVIWIICGIGYLGFCLILKFCKRNRIRRRRKSLCLNGCYMQSLILASLCTVVAIAASGFVLWGIARFNSRANSVMNIVIDAANDASITMYKSSIVVRGMRECIQGGEGRSKASKFLISASQTLDSRAANIAAEASKNRHLMHRGLEIAYIVTSSIVSSTVVLVVSLLALGILKLHRAVQMLIPFCWIFGSICWILFGIYFFIQNFAVDTCSALQGFKDNPFNNSLSSTLPCKDFLSFESILSNITGEIYNMINKVNEKISESHWNIIQICNPFFSPSLHRYQLSHCPKNSISISKIPMILTQRKIPLLAKYFNKMKAYTTSIVRFLDIYPMLESLVHCKTAENSLEEILDKHCIPLKRHLRMVCGTLVLLSMVLMVLSIIWIIWEANNRNLRVNRDVGF